MPHRRTRPAYRPRLATTRKRHVFTRHSRVGTSRTAERSVVITLRGRLDYATAPRLRDAISAALRVTPTPTAIVLDLAEVNALDSIGLGNIVVGYRICRHVGVSLTVRNPSADVMRMFEAAGVRGTLTARWRT